MIDKLETKLDESLLNTNRERKFIDEPGDSNWGQLIVPGKNENPTKTNNGLKVLLMASYRTGYLLIKTLIEIEKKYPNKLNIVGLITDDPLSPNARISMKRRIWRLIDDQKKLKIEDEIIEMALCFGVPCFTGAVKTNYARNLIHHWNPDAIEVFVFGQIIDEPIIVAPKYGIYNFHPADLLHHLGAGPQPFQDLIDRDAPTSRFTVHQLTTQLDAGAVVGQSPLINVRSKDGNISRNLLILEDRMVEPMDLMAVILTKELISAYEKNTEKPIHKIDFPSYFSNLQKKQLMEPITWDKPNESMYEISGLTVKLISKLML